MIHFFSLHSDVPGTVPGNFRASYAAYSASFPINSMADANTAPPQENDAQGTAAVYYETDSPPPNEVSADLSLDGWTNRREKGPWRKVWRERFGWIASNQINNINNNNSGGGSDGGTAAPSTASPGPTNRRGRRNSVGPVTCQVPACGKTLGKSVRHDEPSVRDG